MNAQALKPLIHPIQVISTIFGMSMNSLLILLILYRSPQNLGVYKFLMIYISVFELFFGVLELMAVPDFWTRGSAFIVITDPGSSTMPNCLLQISVLVYCGSFALSLAIFGGQFVYRYQVFRGNTSWTDNRPRNIIFWMGSPLIFAVIWAISCGTFLGRNQYVEEVLSTDILPLHYNNVSIDDIGLVSVYFYPKLKTGEEVINWSSFIGMSLTTTILMTTESIMIFAGLKCYLAIKALMNQSLQSKAFRQLQHQLFYALVSQTIIPIVFMQFPVTILYGSIFLNSSNEFFGILLSLTISLYLATDALPTILIIKDFRVTIIEYLHCIQCNIKLVLPKKRNGVGNGNGASTTQTAMNAGKMITVF